jgi:NADH:ubiquinone oxidoreductase subunit 3 (subunit A)
MLKLSWYYKLAPNGCWRRQDDDTLFEVEFAIVMLQRICLKVEFVIMFPISLGFTSINIFVNRRR